MQQNKRLSTSKERKWELLHSLWIGWTFVLYLGWVAFIYIGLRARQRRWILWGLFYSIPLMLELVTSFTNLWPAANEYTWQGYLVAAVIILVGVTSLFHAFKVRKEYLIRLQTLSAMRNRRPATSKGKKWELLHSLWIGWTFTLFFSWLAFVYIGLRINHKRWVLWAVLYAAPLILLLTLTPESGSWLATLAVSAILALGVVSIVHAFLVRKEYLLRLELLQRETSKVSVTSRGRRWELLHSLWVGWTFTIGLFSWVAFFYIGLRARRMRWILWGVLYLVIFAIFAIPASSGPDNEIAKAAVGPMIVAGFISIVHALLVRNDYLLRLENRMQEAAEVDTVLRRRLEAEYASRVEASPPRESTEQPEPPHPSAASVGPHGSGTPETAITPPLTRPALTPVGIEADSALKTSVLSFASSVPYEYPLPLSFSWSLLASLWDPRDRYREQLRHAENVLAFLGSVSLALLEKQDYERAQIDLKMPWQGGISFGAWKLIVQRSTKVLRTYKDNPLASAIQRLNIGSEKKGFGADIAALINARNHYHHGRGPTMEEEIVNASNEAQERLQRCMEALSFLTQYPIRLVQDFDVDRHSGEFLLKCLRMVGDGPGFPQEKAIFPEALPRGDLYLDLGNQNWVSLYPFAVASNCPHCRYRETYFIDRWNDRKGTTLMKSFERGHTEERRDVSDSLSALASEYQSPQG